VTCIITAERRPCASVGFPHRVARRRCAHCIADGRAFLPALVQRQAWWRCGLAASRTSGNCKSLRSPMQPLRTILLVYAGDGTEQGSWIGVLQTYGAEPQARRWPGGSKHLLRRAIPVPSTALADDELRDQRYVSPNTIRRRHSAVPEALAKSGAVNHIHLVELRDRPYAASDHVQSRTFYLAIAPRSSIRAHRPAIALGRHGGKAQSWDAAAEFQFRRRSRAACRYAGSIPTPRTTSLIRPWAVNPRIQHFVCERNSYVPKFIRTHARPRAATTARLTRARRIGLAMSTAGLSLTSRHMKLPQPPTRPTAYTSAVTGRPLFGVTLAISGLRGHRSRVGHTWRRTIALRRPLSSMTRRRRRSSRHAGDVRRRSPTRAANSTFARLETARDKRRAGQRINFYTFGWSAIIPT